MAWQPTNLDEQKNVEGLLAAVAQVGKANHHRRDARRRIEERREH